MPTSLAAWLQSCRDASGRVARWLTRRLTPRRLAPHLRRGRLGESLAAAYLRHLGYRVLAHNAQLPEGEADLVCRAPDGQTHVLVEIKARMVLAARSANATRAEDAVDADKARRLAQIARALARANHWPPGTVRIDVVGIDLDHLERPREIRHHPGAVSVGY